MSLSLIRLSLTNLNGIVCAMIYFDFIFVSQLGMNLFMILLYYVVPIQIFNMHNIQPILATLFNEKEDAVQIYTRFRSLSLHNYE